MTRTLEQKVEDWHRNRHSEARAGGHHMFHDHPKHRCSTDVHLQLAVYDVRNKWRY